jgi:transposase
MLSVTPAVRVLLCTLPTDMRRSFDTLAGMVRQHLGHDPLSGTLFVFHSRGGDRVKVLYWDRDGYALWYKRLEKGTFRFPDAAPGAGPGPAGASPAAVEVSASELMMLLEGVDLRSVKRSERFVLKPS